MSAQGASVLPITTELFTNTLIEQSLHAIEKPAFIKRLNYGMVLQMLGYIAGAYPGAGKGRDTNKLSFRWLTRADSLIFYYTGQPVITDVSRRTSPKKNQIHMYMISYLLTYMQLHYSGTSII